MDTDCFVYAPVLNFLHYNNEKGVEATVILKFAVEFFESSDIAKSKKIFWDSLPKLTEPYPRRTGSNAALNHLKDMLELLQNQSASEDMPVFVIRSPAAVPCIPAVAYSRIASKLNEIQQTLSQVNEKISTYDLNFPSLPSSAIGSDTSKATVIITNIPRDLDNASKRKKRIEQVNAIEQGSKLMRKFQLTI